MEGWVNFMMKVLDWQATFAYGGAPQKHTHDTEHRIVIRHLCQDFQDSQASTEIFASSQTLWISCKFKPFQA
jgi:hypothetical protein